MPTAPMNPLFSIITVTYNAADTVGRTVSSVNAQSCRLFEHIIVDGASTDDTVDIVKATADMKSTRIHSEPDRGLYDAMNRGIGMACGDYLIFLNAGDKFHSPDTLQQIADTIMSNDYPGIVYGQTDLVDDAGTRIGARHLSAPDNLTLDSFRHGMVVCHQAFVVLRRLAPHYNLRYRFSADYEWCIRCLQHSRLNVAVPGVLIDYLSEGLTTANHRASLIERFKIMAHYYGYRKAVAAHISFIPRALRRKFNKKSDNRQK